jgi:hypothetical protein
MIEITNFNLGKRFGANPPLSPAQFQRAAHAIGLGSGTFGEAGSGLRFTLREIHGAGHFQCWRADRMLAEFLVSPAGPNETAWEFFVAHFQQLLKQQVVTTEVPGVIGPRRYPWTAIIFRSCLAPADLLAVFPGTLALAEAYVRLRQTPFGPNSRN